MPIIEYNANCLSEVSTIANIRQIAKLAGVSVTTVSRVINDHPYVTAEKRSAVRAAMAQLKYAPNRNAVNLSRGKTSMIAVMLPFANHPYFSGMIEGIAQAALLAQYQIVLCQTDYKPEEERRVLDLLRNKQVDGILVCSKKAPWALFESYADSGPMVACEYVDSPYLSSVFIQYQKVTRQAMDILIKLGHRRIGFCIGRPDSANSLRRIKGYEEGLNSIGIKDSSKWLFPNCYRMENGIRAIHSIIQSEERPTALLVAGNQPAAGMVIEARKLGLRIPEDLSIISFDNSPVSEVLEISSYNLSSTETGRLAFELFLKQMQMDEPLSEHQEIVLEYVERASVAPVASV